MPYDVPGQTPTVLAGSIVTIVGLGSLGWILQPGAGQTIQAPTTSASTSITCNQQYGTISVICVVPNVTWVVMGYPNPAFIYT